MTLIIKKEDDDMDGDYEKKTFEVEKNLTELMQLFQELVKTPSIRTKVFEVFSVQNMRTLLKTILGCNNSELLQKPKNLFHVSISYRICNN